MFRHCRTKHVFKTKKKVIFKKTRCKTSHYHRGQMDRFATLNKNTEHSMEPTVGRTALWDEVTWHFLFLFFISCGNVYLGLIKVGPLINRYQLEGIFERIFYLKARKILILIKIILVLRATQQQYVNCVPKFVLKCGYFRKTLVKKSIR